MTCSYLQVWILSPASLAYVDFVSNKTAKNLPSKVLKKNFHAELKNDWRNFGCTLRSLGDPRVVPEWPQSVPKVALEWPQSGHRVVPELSQSPRVIMVIMVIRVWVIMICTI